MSATRTTSAARRRGFTMVEITASVVMLATAMSLTVQLLGGLAAERRAAERRLCAVQEVANLMERVAARPWGEVTPESLRAVSLSPAAHPGPPGGRAGGHGRRRVREPGRETDPPPPPMARSRRDLDGPGPADRVDLPPWG